MINQIYAFILLFLVHLYQCECEATSICKTSMAYHVGVKNIGRAIDVVKASPFPYPHLYQVHYYPWLSAVFHPQKINTIDHKNTAVRKESTCSDKEGVRLITRIDELENEAFQSFMQVGKPTDNLDQAKKNSHGLPLFELSMDRDGHEPFFNLVERSQRNYYKDILSNGGSILWIEASCPLCTYEMDMTNLYPSHLFMRRIRDLGDASTPAVRAQSVSSFLSSYQTHFATRATVGGKYVKILAIPKFNPPTALFRRFKTCIQRVPFWSESIKSTTANSVRFTADVRYSGHISVKTTLYVDECLKILNIPFNIREGIRIEVHKHGFASSIKKASEWRKHLEGKINVGYRGYAIVQYGLMPLANVFSQVRVSNMSVNVSEAAKVLKYGYKNYCEITGRSCKKQQCQVRHKVDQRGSGPLPSNMLCPPSTECLPRASRGDDDYDVHCCDALGLPSPRFRETQLFDMGRPKVGDRFFVYTHHRFAKALGFFYIEPPHISLYLLSDELSPVFGGRLEHRKYHGICGVPGTVKDYKQAVEWDKYFSRSDANTSAFDHVQAGTTSFIKTQYFYQYGFESVEKAQDLPIEISFPREGVYEMRFPGAQACTYENKGNKTEQLVGKYLVSNVPYEIVKVDKLIKHGACNSPVELKNNGTKTWRFDPRSGWERRGLETTGKPEETTMQTTTTTMGTNQALAVCYHAVQVVVFLTLLYLNGKF